MPRVLTVLMLAFTYAIASQPTRAQGGITRYVYDDNGRLRAVITPAGEAAVNEYDPAGNPTRVRRLTADMLELLAFSPREGAVGDLVTFVGVGFGGGVSSVSFNGIAAQVIEVSPSAVIARVPGGTTTGPVTIVTPRGSVTTSTPFIVVSVRVIPSVATLLPGDSFQFTAEVSLPGDGSVTWSATAGTISPNGLYTAPNQPSSSITVRATSVAFPTQFAEAQVTVLDPNNTRPLIAPLVSIRRGSLASANATTINSVSVRSGQLSGSVIVVNLVSVRSGALINAPAYSASVSATTGPYISSISPTQIGRGTTVSLTIAGTKLNGATALRFIDANGSIDSSIVASNITVTANGAQLTATVVVNPNAALGQRIVVVSTPSGGSLTVGVGVNTIQIGP